MLFVLQQWISFWNGLRPEKQQYDMMMVLCLHSIQFFDIFTSRYFYYTMHYYSISYSKIRDGMGKGHHRRRAWIVCATSNVLFVSAVVVFSSSRVCLFLIRPTTIIVIIVLFSFVHFESLTLVICLGLPTLSVLISRYF